MSEKEKFNLGYETIRANRIGSQLLQETPCEVPLRTDNFVSPDWTQVLPEPIGDWYLRGLSVAALGSEESVVCLRLIDGLREYYQRVGLLSSDSHVLEVTPSMVDTKQFGFPNADPMELLRGAVELTHDGRRPYTLVSTFLGELVEQQAHELGIRTLELPESALSNSKARLRMFAEEYNIPLVQGILLTSAADIATVVNDYGSYEDGIWVKFPIGSGGDLVRHIPHPLTEEKLMEVIEGLHESVELSFQEGTFAGTIDDVWPTNNPLPVLDYLVVEADVRNFGKLVTIGSNYFIRHRDGLLDIKGTFKQLTENGSYIGSLPYYPNDDVRQKLYSATKTVANYNASENGYYGIQGIDWFLVEQSDGSSFVYVSELNARPIVSTYPDIISRKINADYWINTNVFTNTDIETFSDYEQLLGSSLVNGSIENGWVIPLAFRTMVTRQGVIPSPNFKAMIVGNSFEHCKSIIEDLRKSNKGIRFTP